MSAASFALGLEVDVLLQLLASPHQIAGPHQREAEVAVGERVVRLQIDRLPERLDRLPVIATRSHRRDSR